MWLCWVINALLVADTSWSLIAPYFAWIWMLASRATLPQKQRQQPKVEIRGRRREERRAKEWATRENGRRWEQDEKCNYDFEKWARPPSRENEYSRATGFREASRVPRLDRLSIGNCGAITDVSLQRHWIPYFNRRETPLFAGSYRPLRSSFRRLS